MRCDLSLNVLGQRSQGKGLRLTYRYTSCLTWWRRWIVRFDKVLSCFTHGHISVTKGHCFMPLICCCKVSKAAYNVVGEVRMFSAKSPFLDKPCQSSLISGITYRCPRIFPVYHVNLKFTGLVVFIAFPKDFKFTQSQGTFGINVVDKLCS